MSKRRLLLGDEAVALGAIDAGLSGVYAYPGTPSTEITEFIQNNQLAKERGIHSRWCTNEKTAMEAALGMSYCGKRALVCMKHVGMNVCADAFVNSAITGVNGGLVVLAADDPSMHSSQNEQDSRFYGKFAMVPIFEPGNQQECYDIMSQAFDLSERLRLPVLMRLVTRLAHSRSNVVVSDSAREQNAFHPDNDKHWVLLPAIARKQYSLLISLQPKMEASSEQSLLNTLETLDGKGLGIIASGIGYNYVREAQPQGVSAILKIGQYPLPEEKVRQLAAESDAILVVEDGQPFIEEGIRGMLGAGYPVRGRLTGDLPRTGELNPDWVRKALGKDVDITFNDIHEVVGRPPALCQGCGHRDVYKALNEIAAQYDGCRIFGDIGCYTLGALPPFQSIASCVDMGASITMAKGAADAGQRPAIAIIGDSTFTHSGMTGLLDAINDHANITVVISDNLTTAMTGGQDSAGTNKFEQICIGLGVPPEHVRVVVPLPKNMPEIVKTLKEEIEYPDVSVIIPRRECMQTLARHMREKNKQSKK